MHRLRPMLCVHQCRFGLCPWSTVLEIAELCTFFPVANLKLTFETSSQRLFPEVQI